MMGWACMTEMRNSLSNIQNSLGRAPGSAAAPSSPKYNWISSYEHKTFRESFSRHSFLRVGQRYFESHASWRHRFHCIDLLSPELRGRNIFAPFLLERPKL